MKIIVLDNRRSYLKTLQGEYSNGTFKYKSGGIFGFGTIEKTLDIIYDGAIPSEKGKTCYVWFDGKDYHQLFFNDEKPTQITIMNSVEDYARDFKVAQLTKSQHLDRPFDLKELVQILLLILVVIELVLVYVNTQNLNKVASQLVAPLNSQISQNNQLIHILLNETKQLNNEYNLTITKIP